MPVSGLNIDISSDEGKSNLYANRDSSSSSPVSITSVVYLIYISI